MYSRLTAAALAAPLLALIVSADEPTASPKRPTTLAQTWVATHAPAGSASRSSAPPIPGVYVSKPFSCIIIIPGGDLDSKMVHPAPRVAPRMPIVSPELRLMPKK